MVDSYLTSYETEQKDFENIPRTCIGKSLKLFDCALLTEHFLGECSGLTQRCPTD